MISDPASRPHWQTPALVIAAGCAIALLSFGIRSSFGVFLEPMSSERLWGREVFALAIALQNLLWGLGQPFAGAIADRIGTARVLACGGLLYAAGVLLMSQASTPLMLHLSAGLLVGLGMSGAGFGVVLAAISRRVPAHKRSWALGLGTAAGSAGQFILVPLGQSFLEAYGWSMALVLLGSLALLMIPLSTALSGRAEEASRIQQSVAEALQEARAHSGYVYLTLGFFVCGFQVAFIAAHLPAYVTDLGLAARTGAWALSLVGLFNIVGSYSAGVLGGKLSKKYLLSSLYFLRSIVIIVFMLMPPTQASVLIFSAAIGLLWLSTVPLTSGLVAQIFGLRYMGMLFGIVFLSHQLGSFLGVWLGGYLFDRTGSYDVVWWLSVALGFIAALLHWPIDERPVERLALETRG